MMVVDAQMHMLLRKERERGRETLWQSHLMIALLPLAKNTTKALIKAAGDMTWHVSEEDILIHPDAGVTARFRSFKSLNEADLRMVRLHR